MSVLKTDSVDYGDKPPERFVRRVSGVYYEPSQLYSMIKKLEKTESQLQVNEPDGLNNSLQPCQTPSESAKKLENVTFDFADAQYDIDYSFQVNHTPSEGGQTLHVTSLRKNGNPILVGMLVVFYTTYSDDSEDFEASRKETTYLLENETFAESLLSLM